MRQALGRRFLAVDIGTSSVKTACFDQAGRLLSSGSQAYETAYPAPGRAEQDPEQWWAAAVPAIRSAVREMGGDPRSIAGVGLTGQTPTHVLIDADGRPLTPVITWQDGRAAAEALWLGERLESETWIRLQGAAVPFGASWPVPRLLWLRREAAGDLERARWVVQPKDLVYRRLTGVVATDAASWLGLVHQTRGDVSPELLELIGIGGDRIPPVYRPWEAPGTLLPEAAAELGLTPGIPVAVGWNDSWCHVLGTGLGQYGKAFDISGTSEITGRVAAGVQIHPVPGLLALPVLDNLVGIYGGTQSGGGCLNWISTVTGHPSYDEVLAEAAGVAAGAERLIFLPYLQGERTPLWDPLGPSGPRALLWALHEPRPRPPGPIGSRRGGLQHPPCAGDRRRLRAHPARRHGGLRRRRPGRSLEPGEGRCAGLPGDPHRRSGERPVGGLHSGSGGGGGGGRSERGRRPDGGGRADLAARPAERPCLPGPLSDLPEALRAAQGLLCQPGGRRQRRPVWLRRWIMCWRSSRKSRSAAL